MCHSYHFSHIADYYTEVWRTNEFSNAACFLAQDYDNLSSIDQTLKEIEAIASPLHHPSQGTAHNTQHPSYRAAG